MEDKLLARKLLGKCGVLWSHFVAEIEAFQIHMVTTTYREVEMAAVRSECWTVVITMVRVIWRDLRKVRVEAETAYFSEAPAVMVNQYLRGTFQAHRVMDKFLRTQFLQHLEVAPHIILYLFEHRAPRV